MSFDPHSAAAAEPPHPGATSQATVVPPAPLLPTLSPTAIAPPFRRPLKTFMEEARLAAAQGLKSTVAITPESLVLTLEQPGAGGADNLGAAPPEAPALGQRAPKPWR